MKNLMVVLGLIQSVSAMAESNFNCHVSAVDHSTSTSINGLSNTTLEKCVSEAKSLAINLSEKMEISYSYKIESSPENKGRKLTVSGKFTAEQFELLNE